MKVANKSALRVRLFDMVAVGQSEFVLHQQLYRLFIYC